MIGPTIKDAAGGHVELCYNEEWRAVCAGDWDLNDAEVVCRQVLNISQSGIYIEATCIYMHVCTIACTKPLTLQYHRFQYNKSDTVYIQ